MLDLLFASPLLFFIVFPGLLIAITVHEFAHAWAADQLGDPTPRVQGRLKLDPRVHLDPIGTLAILFTSFGWGKPVQFDPYNLKEPMRDTALISIAGPLSNMIMAGILALPLNFISMSPLVSTGLFLVLLVNVTLAIFNLVPVYPLDGSKIITALLPSDAAEEYTHFMRRYGLVVLLLLIFPWGNSGSPIGNLISPVIDAVVRILV